MLIWREEIAIENLELNQNKGMQENNSISLAFEKTQFDLLMNIYETALTRSF